VISSVTRRWQAMLGVAVLGGFFVALVSAVVPSRGEPLRVGVVLRAGESALPGKAVKFSASTSAKLAGAGGHFALELRGINLKRTPRATYARADYVSARHCTTTPCRWSVTMQTAASYEFRTDLIDLRNRGSAAHSAPARVSWSQPPHAMKVLINGNPFPLNPLVESTDKYMPIRAGRLRVEAHWKSNASPGYYVLISTTEPQQRDYATCTAGTSCVVRENVSILKGQEMSWTVRVFTAQTLRPVAGFRVCLIGKG
jgi:hypothetical protein